MQRGFPPFDENTSGLRREESSADIFISRTKKGQIVGFWINPDTAHSRELTAFSFIEFIIELAQSK